jgi:histidinol-phosphatase (PHP family)
MIDDYFGLLRRAAEVPAFDCLGHLDYYIRYGQPFYGDEIFRVEIEQFEPIFEILRKNGRGIEVNTSQFRYGINKFHPEERIVERAVAVGVPIISVGSDTHRMVNLSAGIPEAYAFLQALGVKPIFPRSR